MIGEEGDVGEEDGEDGVGQIQTTYYGVKMNNITLEECLCF